MSEWDTRTVTDMNYLFYGDDNTIPKCRLSSSVNSFNCDISKWKTGNVEGMSGMFENAKAFNQDIGGWDTSQVSEMA